jgi:DNA polymerase-3 subunit gamma/tau
VMEEINRLLNAGNSPSQMARQLVRYLRNCLMAKLGGEQTELLQISGDERARAARTALLFSEEELTRNLQIVLRTFDDLNYRQEQRFHLELGLLKLIHAQRLLPMEELLSGVAAGAATQPEMRAAAPSSSARPTASAPVRQATAPAASALIAPAPIASPFGPAGGGWSSGPKMDTGTRADAATAPVATMERAVSSPLPGPGLGPTALAGEASGSSLMGSSPFPASASPASGYGSTATLTEGALAKAPEAATLPTGAASMEVLRHAIGSALVTGGHTSAAQLLGSGPWIMDGASLRIEVPGIGKKMLALTVNAAAEKIIRNELQRLGAPMRFLVVPGDGTAATPQAAAPVSAPLAGSVQQAALSHPLVQRAQEIFKAEVRSVVDLRPDEPHASKR